MNDCPCGHPRRRHDQHGCTVDVSTDRRAYVRCHDGFPDEDLLELQAELDELERTDPDVRAAAESYDRMVERITRPPTTRSPVVTRV